MTKTKVGSIKNQPFFSSFVVKPITDDDGIHRDEVRHDGIQVQVHGGSDADAT